MNNLALDRLHQDHLQIDTLLRLLEYQFTAIERIDKPDYALMYQVLHYLTFYPDRYHHVLEDLLFERLASRRNDMAVMIQSLEQEHESLTKQGVRLRTMLETVLNDLPMQRSVLADAGIEYITGYRQHLTCEEEQVFPALDDGLSQTDWITLVTRFEWQMDPLFAAQVSDQYKRIADALKSMDIDFPALLNGDLQSCSACSDRIY